MAKLLKQLTQVAAIDILIGVQFTTRPTKPGGVPEIPEQHTEIRTINIAVEIGVSKVPNGVTGTG